MPKNLLDTHAFIWFVNGDNLLSKKARNIIESEDSENYVSIVSIWEIAIKISLQKLQLKAPFTEIKSQLIENNFSILPVEIEDTLLLANLPFHHRDPFDRLLITQAKRNNLLMISKDENFNAYGIQLAW